MGMFPTIDMSPHVESLAGLVRKGNVSICVHIAYIWLRIKVEEFQAQNCFQLQSMFN